MTDLSVHHPTSQSPGDTAGASGALASWRDYVELLKPRVMSLVIFTGLVGMVLAPGAVHPVLGAVALLAIAVGAGAAGCLNMWYDADIDAIMIRTRRRPIPRGSISREDALFFGAILSFASVLTMWLAVGIVPALLLAFTIGFYLFIYTMGLKRRTPQNIVIGGAAGALPPVIGWATVTGSVSLEPLVLFLIIFMWTPPHFWALALYRNGDYEKAGVPMMPVVAGKQSTRAQILAYAVLLAPVTLLPTLMGYAGLAYAAIAALASAVFVGLAAEVWFLGRAAGDNEQAEIRADRAARRLFAYSIFYLFILFFALLAEWVVGSLL